MKKLLGILVLGLLWCNTSFAECIEGNCVDGWGIYMFPDGTKYVGEHKGGKENGQGTYTYANGTKYDGEYKNGKQHGQGTMTWPDGKKYVGEWKNNKYRGQGTYTWPSGNKYVGEYKDSLPHGKGTWTFTDGSKYVGEYKDGKMHGKGTYTKADGTVTKGIWKKDKFVKGAETEESIIEKYKSSLKLCVVGVVEYYDFTRWQAWTDCFGILKKKTPYGTWIIHAEYKNGFQTGKTLIEYPNGDRLFTKTKKEICSGNGYVITADGTIYKVKLTKDCVVKSQKVIK